MAQKLLLKWLALLLVVGTPRPTHAGFLFTDIRPNSYNMERTLDIHVGSLISPESTIAHDFYYVNYCPSRGVHHYSDTLSMNDVAPAYIEGATMYDTTLHESFFYVSELTN